MCCCTKPNQNGQPGYSWDGKNIGTRNISAPSVPDGATLVYDEPGRCSPMLDGKPYKLDHHCHHYRIYKGDYGHVAVVELGMGRVEFMESYDVDRLVPLMRSMDSDARFIMLMTLEHTWNEAESKGRASESHKYRSAFADGRLKKRRLPKRGTTKIWIEDGPRCYDTEEGQP